MRVEDGEVTLRTRKDLDWTEKFLAIANAAGRFPDCINQRMRHDRKQFAGG
jgi:bifunctional non-homologous end joining protein LigD